MSEKNDQTSLFFTEEITNSPVTCLGLTFKNDEERREYFSSELRKKLQDLTEIDGFPIGDYEDIIALSDPPYYTACPNPWLNDFITEIESNKSEFSMEEYHREPFTSDISEGKNDPIYNAHSYHTKVPYKAIMKYILHYTNPGDIILDGFSGTGMTGVAAQMCNNPAIVKSLGYDIVGEDILNLNNKKFSKIGIRNSILSDLSPAASFISYNYNTPLDIDSFQKESERILRKVEKKLSWMYETNHVTEKDSINKSNDIQKGKINYVVWSDVFLCSECSNEIVFFKNAVDQNTKQVMEQFKCKKCGALLNKNKLDRSINVKYDSILHENIKQSKKIPVLIKYSIGSKRFEKQPDNEDFKKIDVINDLEIKKFVPANRMPAGDESRRNDKVGITHVHHFYTKRNLLILSELLHEINSSIYQRPLKLVFQSIVMTLGSNLVRYNMGKRGNGPLSGTLYISSMVAETEILKVFSGKVMDFCKAFLLKNKSSILSTQSLTDLNLKENSIDYIFTDPPFGANIMYSELNYIWESWLKVFSNNNKEAIVNKTQNKDFSVYQSLMEKCFSQYYKVLKPGRWMTVEFSNSKANIWNAIQEAIQKSGFVIANVAVLDKKQGSFKAVTSTVAVKQDLVITAYKPYQKDIENIEELRNSKGSIWAFVNQHLEKLPSFIGSKGNAEVIVERTPRVLFDRMVAYHVLNGLPVPLSSSEFQMNLLQNYPVRDGMVFLENQVAEYDKKRILVKEFSQLSLFVADENSAIEWLRQQLNNKPQSRQDLHPNFMKETQHIAKHELLPELDSLLEQNFLMYEGTEEVPSQIHGYLSSNYKDLRGLQKTDSRLKEKAKNRWYVPDPNKQADLEKLREKSLLREFDSYKTEIEGNKKKLKQFRTEAIRTGFKKAWSEKDYETIVKIGERLPEKVLQEDDKLLMYFDNAQIRLGV
jgi:DNA modification methylase